MIKNVVLDIGNVLVSFYPDIYISQFITKKGEIDYYNHICFKSAEWKCGDLGTKTREEIIDAICEKYPEDAENVRMIMENCDDMLRVSKKNTEVVKKLKAAGVEVYYLSNTNAHAFEYMSATYEVFKFMDGGIASYLDGVLKPSADIFELFLSRYGKIAEECVFVDDMPTNVNGARAVGLNGIILKNIDDLEDELCKFPEIREALNK
jgi:putative hydrolase of the HAD superfamily